MPAEHIEDLEADRPRAQRNARRIRTNSVLALSAMFLSAISAAAVIWQVKVAADQRSATVWPYIQAGAGRTSSPPLFSIRLANAGVGPALIRYFAVRVDGKPVRSWREFLAAISQDEAVRRAAFREEIIAGSGWVLAPQNTVTAFFYRDA